ncbi:MAG: RNA-binding S4 domain-containing protein [Alphaproteobacteria bacterium]|nr:RNA-binding S4 domain-containing protein [Alphaproteobacteria bacterium]
MTGNDGYERSSRRLDQWLWFSRFVRSRSLAARLCTAGLVTVNGAATTKSNHPVRLGDIVAVPQGGFRRTVRVLAFGARRGPAPEARGLYEETAAAVRIAETEPEWVPLLGDEGPDL